jgi:DNA-binding XRE family transcriptional regulator
VLGLLVGMGVGLASPRPAVVLAGHERRRAQALTAATSARSLARWALRAGDAGLEAPARLVDATWLRVLVALFPALLVCWVLRAFVRYVRDSDEMQRRIELESGAIAALLVRAVYLAAGFLQSAELIDVAAKVALIMVFPAMCLVYGFTKLFVSRRYLWNNRLRELREARGWSQGALAEQLEVSRQTVNALETGKYDPSLPLAFRIARMFGEPIRKHFFRPTPLIEERPWNAGPAAS